MRLVDRNTRSISLTEVGRSFVPLVEKTLQDLDGALASIDDLKALRKGMVRIAAPQLMACTLLPDVIAAYRAEHPGVQVRLTDCAVENVLTRVAAGEVDFGIGPERATSAEIAAQPLFEMPFMVVFPKGHALEALPASVGAMWCSTPSLRCRASSPSAWRWTCMCPCKIDAAPEQRGGLHDHGAEHGQRAAGHHRVPALRHLLVQLHHLQMRPCTSPNCDAPSRSTCAATRRRHLLRRSSWNSCSLMWPRTAGTHHKSRQPRRPAEPSTPLPGCQCVPARRRFRQS